VIQFVAQFWNGVAHNGKSIGEVRENEEPLVQVRPN